MTIKEGIKLVLKIMVLTFIVLNFEWVVGGYPHKKWELERDVLNYLTEIESYSRDEIQSIEVNYIRKENDYLAEVVFADEMETYYRYWRNKKFGWIVQTGFGPTGKGNFDRNKAKHLEKPYKPLQ